MWLLSHLVLISLPLQVSGHPHVHLNSLGFLLSLGNTDIRSLPSHCTYFKTTLAQGEWDLADNSKVPIHQFLFEPDNPKVL